MAFGLASLSLLPAQPATFDIVWRMLICGIGFGFFNTPNNRAIITSAPPTRAGAASGMQATSRLLGQSVGAALVALMFGLVAARRRHDRAGGRGVCGGGGSGGQFPADGGAGAAGGVITRGQLSQLYLAFHAKAGSNWMRQSLRPWAPLLC